MADPVLATPSLPAGFLTKYLDRCPPHGSAFVAAVDTAAAAIVWPPPAFRHANTGSYPADPTLATPALPAGIGHRELFAAVPPPAGSAFPGAVAAAQNAVVWTAPAYPHSNYPNYDDDSGGGGLPEAPGDGRLYLRQGSTASWVPFA